MKTIHFFSRLTLLFLFFATIFMSMGCSKDKEDVECGPGFTALNADLLGTYGGVLTSTGSTIVTNTSGTATLVETSCKTYSINFSDNVPSITGIRFSDLTSGDGSYNYVNVTATTTVNIDMNELTVTQTGNPVITFTGTK